MKSKLTIHDLTPAARKKAGLKAPRKSHFQKEAVRTHALRVLAEISSLTQEQRGRVLAHAQKGERDMTTECDEIAATMLPTFLHRFKGQANHDQAVGYVRQWMPDESQTVIANVAWALFTGQPPDKP